MSSLSNMIKSLQHKGVITPEECDALLKKLRGHDRELLNRVIDVIYLTDIDTTMKTVITGLIDAMKKDDEE